MPKVENSTQDPGTKIYLATSHECLQDSDCPDTALCSRQMLCEAVKCSHCAGWRYFERNDKCYKYYSNLLDYYAAHDMCFAATSGQGNIASIPDQATSSFLITQFISLYQTNAWIGGTNYPHGTLRWFDGSPWSFTNWAPGEPNMTIGGERLLMMYDWEGETGTWTTDSYDEEHPFICSF